jgi:hypothetical protein
MDAPNGPCDLHLHSHYSDGTLSPEELVSFSASIGLSAVSITDHDTINGQAEALEAGARFGIEVVPGIEFSIDDGGSSHHILGYCFDHEDAALSTAVAALAAQRIERAREIARLLSDRGMAVPFEDVLAEAGKGSVGRPHVASVLYKRGYVSSVPEAFSRWIADGAPCNVPKKTLPLDEVVGLVRGAGGVAVWAHPGWNVKKDDLLDRFVAAGVRGIEVWHPNHSERIVEALSVAARDRGLVMTGGSDYHFAEIMQADIGEITAPRDSLVALRRAAARGPYLP